MSQEQDNPFLNGLWKENPVFVQVLGMCPTLAVTNSVRNALAMGLATTFVLVVSNALISMVRNQVPKQVRIATFIAITATAVTVTDYLVKAISIDIYKALGPFLALIVVNCVILARAEAFAAKNGCRPFRSRRSRQWIGLRLWLDVPGHGAGSPRRRLFSGHLALRTELRALGALPTPPGGFITLAFWLLLFAGTGIVRSVRRRIRSRKPWRCAHERLTRTYLHRRTAH
jgi:electron transport complex protein RnfE